MDKNTSAFIVSLVVTFIGLGLLIYQTYTDSVNVHKIGILYALIFGIGVMASIAFFQMRKA
ncbi:MAG: hypothetical protein M1529_07465 [Candidatus Thermoplasmatota archaeon]|jgi:membrane protein involved in colicin uptake|nr:hypothetical protein [Candidatus Thermoplasmatota archaeon]